MLAQKKYTKPVGESRHGARWERTLTFHIKNEGVAEALIHINPFINDKKTKQQLLIQHRHRTSLGEAVHVGKAGICMKRSLLTMTKIKSLKNKYAGEKNTHTHTQTHTQHTHTHVEIFSSLCSAAISAISVSVLLSFALF